MIAESPFARRVRLAEAAVEAREAVEAEEAAVAAAEAEAAVPPVEWTFVAPGPDAVARTPSQDPIAWAEAAAELAEDEGADDRRVAAAMALAARVGERSMAAGVGRCSSPYSAGRRRRDAGRRGGGVGAEPTLGVRGAVSVCVASKVNTSESVRS